MSTRQAPRMALTAMAALRRPLPPLVAVLLAAALAGGSAPAITAAAPPSLSAHIERRLSAAVDRELRIKHFPGAIVAVQRAGRRPWIIARGVADLRTRAPMRTDDHVRIGSVTKSFVTTLVLQLAQQGRISLDDHIDRYVTGVPGGAHITLRELGNMTAGLTDYFASEQVAFDYITGETFTPVRLLAAAFALPPLFPPGTAWSYSNTNTVLLGRVVEAVTGQPLADVLRARIFRPLGLRESSLPATTVLPRPYANGYTFQTINGRLGDATFNTPTATWAAGGMVSTVRDLLRAAPLFGTGRPLLDAATQRERLRWVGFPPNSVIQQYGFGVFGFNGWIGHNGGIPGYTAIAWHLPRLGLSLIVSVNSDIHIGGDPEYAYEPASEIGHQLTKILSPRNVAPLAVKKRGSHVTTVS